MSSDPERQPLVPKEEKIVKEEGSLTLPTIMEDAIDIVKLGVPIFISRLSFVGMRTTDTALLGHVSADALSAAALSDLWTMCSAVLIRGSVLGVLVGGAVGAGNPKLAGIYLQVSYVVLSSLAIFVVIAWLMTERVWLIFGSDPEISRMAGYYASVLAISIPGTLAFSQLSQFFSAQRIMAPEVNSAAFGLISNLLLGLILVLGIFIPNWDGFGFEACPIVTSTVVYLQLAAIVFIYVIGKRLHAPCWDGWNWQEITTERIKTYSYLYFPAALSSASDFWRVAVIGAVAAKLGEAEVAVFNTSYRIMWIALILVGSLAGASSINMSMRLGKMDPMGARQAGYVGIAMATVALAFLCIAIVTKSRLFGMIFTNDEDFLNLFADASLPFTATLFLMNLSVVIERIPYSMGRTSEVFWMGLFASWLGQVPAVICCTRYWRNDLTGLYTGMAIGYFVLAILYSFIAFTSDWQKYAEIARERSESKVT